MRWRRTGWLGRRDSPLNRRHGAPMRTPCDKHARGLLAYISLAAKSLGGVFSPALGPVAAPHLPLAGGRRRAEFKMNAISETTWTNAASSGPKTPKAARPLPTKSTAI